MARKKKKFYAVARGRRPGIYTTWAGPGGAQEQIEGYSGALYRGFHTREEAERWLKDAMAPPSTPPAADYSPRETADRQVKNSSSVYRTAGPDAGSGEKDASSVATEPTDEVAALLKAGKVVIYTDGGAIANPGPGGYGVVLRYNQHRKELAAGYRLTTNNRMELMACIAGLEALKTPSDVVLFSDSQYVVNGIEKGWAKKWRAQGWKRANQEIAENVDLWERLLDLLDRHRVTLRWVRGHAGDPENERCHELATAAMRGPHLLVDEAYEKGRTREPKAEKD